MMWSGSQRCALALAHDARAPGWDRAGPALVANETGDVSRSTRSRRLGGGVTAAVGADRGHPHTASGLPRRARRRPPRVCSAGRRRRAARDHRETVGRAAREPTARARPLHSRRARVARESFVDGEDAAAADSDRRCFPCQRRGASDDDVRRVRRLGGRACSRLWLECRCKKESSSHRSFAFLLATSRSVRLRAACRHRQTCGTLASRAQTTS
jgi:hypothetical protein